MVAAARQVPRSVSLEAAVLVVAARLLLPHRRTTAVLRLLAERRPARGVGLDPAGR